MDGQDGEEENPEPPQPSTKIIPMPAPTSPLQRRSRPSPITPNQTPQERQRSQRNQVTPIAKKRKTSNWEPPADSRHPEYPPAGFFPTRRRQFPPYGPQGYHDGSPPVVVERGGSFDSQGDTPAYREFPPTPPSGPYYYEEHAPKPYNGYWDGAPYHPQGPFPPQRWNYGPPVEAYHQEYPYDRHEDGYSHHRPPPPPHAAPYTYVQQPRLEEKTILRKKFSWKHYPEVRMLSFADLSRVWYFNTHLHAKD